MPEKKYKPSSCGACKYSNTEVGAEVEFLCSKANREIPGTADTIESWCPLSNSDPMPDPQQHLRPEEREKIAGILGYASVHGAMDASIVVELAENLDACRALLKDAKLYLKSYEKASMREGFAGTPHHNGIIKMIKAIAAQLAGIGEK